MCVHSQKVSLYLIVSFCLKAQYITPEHYQDIVEERGITKVCGYPICKKAVTMVSNNIKNVITYHVELWLTLVITAWIMLLFLTSTIQQCNLPQISCVQVTAVSRVKEKYLKTLLEKKAVLK